MKTKIIIAALFLFTSLNVFSQFVGDAAPTPVATTQKTGKTTFTMKYGLAMPSGNMGVAPSNGATPRYSEGYMGAQTGFFCRGRNGPWHVEAREQSGVLLLPSSRCFLENGS